MPQSLKLSIQSDVAPDWLAFNRLNGSRVPQAARNVLLAKVLW
jgi:hypothetical protein